MTSKRIAIACQGGGIQAAFTYGVLRKVLERMKTADCGFEVVGLSGTSAGALCAFMTWYGLVPKDGAAGSPEEAIASLDGLWETFAAQNLAEKTFNSMAVQTLRLQTKGLPALKSSPYSLVHELMIAPLETMGLRKEFVDFGALLQHCAPKLDRIRQGEVEPRLFIGAVEILSGTFQAFDSREPNPATKRNISLQAIEASGTLPEVRKAEHIPDAECVPGKHRDCYYWDGLLSQNPPVREFLTKTESLEEKPEEIWVIRINPQERDAPPTAIEEIEDRRNELTGNLSLNQELEFIQSVNDWIDAFPGFALKYRKVTVRTIKMSKATSASLDVASKFDRSPAFIERLRREGERVAEEFLQGWPDQAGTWPEDAVYPAE